MFLTSVPVLNLLSYCYVTLDFLRQINFFKDKRGKVFFEMPPVPEVMGYNYVLN